MIEFLSFLPSLNKCLNWLLQPELFMFALALLVYLRTGFPGSAKANIRAMRLDVANKLLAYRFLLARDSNGNVSSGLQCIINSGDTNFWAALNSVEVAYADVPLVMIALNNYRANMNSLNPPLATMFIEVAIASGITSRENALKVNWNSPFSPS